MVYKMNTELVIFDLDGTLLDTIDDLAEATNHALTRNGYPTHPLSAYRYFVGNGITKLVERALPETERLQATVDHLRADFVSYYTTHNTVHTHPYEGIEPLIAELKRRGVQMAVASNKYQEATEKLIGRFFASQTFAAVFGQREGVPTKPDPTVVYDILRLTGADPQRTLYVGDSSVDMQTAAHSKLCSVGVTWGFRPRAELEHSGACHLIDHPEQLVALL